MTATRSRHHDESGSAIISGVLISAVVVIMSLMAVNLSLHNQEATGRDRNRTQSVHAAEAGFDAVLSRLQTTSTVLMPCTLAGELDTTPKARFRAEVTYYADPNLTGSPLYCNEPGGPSLTPAGNAVAPAAALIESVGSVGGLERTMQGAVRLSPIMGQFNKALFSDESPDLNNNLEITGANGESADVYTNGDWVCPQSTIVHGSVFAQGLASLDNTCTVDEHLWVKGSLTMKQHTVVGANGVSSNSGIALSQSSHIANNAIAAGACTGCTTARVGGSVSANRGDGNVPDPPVYSFPAVTASTVPWSGYRIEPFSSCAAARTFIGNGSAITSPTLVRINAACELVFSNNSTVTLASDLAIITSGAITTERKVVFRSTSSAARRVLHLIVPIEAEPTCGVPAGNGNITTSNNTDFVDVDFFVYSPCKVQFSNNNPSAAGQVYGGDVVIENLFALQFKAVYVPGVPNDVVGYSTELLYLREVVG
jgi:hypothetical protein